MDVLLKSAVCTLDINFYQWVFLILKGYAYLRLLLNVIQVHYTVMPLGSFGALVQCRRIFKMVERRLKLQ